MGRWVVVPVWHQTGFLPALVIPSSTNKPVWDAPQIPDNNIHRFDGTAPFDCHLGLKFTTEILTLRFAHYQLLFTAGCYFNSPSGKLGHYRI